jgi:hypothetical protein
MQTGKKCVLSGFNGDPDIRETLYIGEVVDAEARGCPVQRTRSEIEVTSREKDGKRILTRTTAVRTIAEGTIGYIWGEDKGIIATREDTSAEEYLRNWKKTDCEPWRPDEALLAVPRDV